MLINAIDPNAAAVSIHHHLPIVADALAALVRDARKDVTFKTAAAADLVIATLERADDLALPEGTRLVVLVDHADRRPVQEARARGALGAIPLDAPVDLLRVAIATVLQGKSWWPVVATAESASDAPAARRLDTLSGQQFRVLDLMSRGRLNKQIAYDLGISEGTVKSHVSSILRKLGVERRTQAIATFITTADDARGGGAHLSRATHAAR